MRRAIGQVADQHGTDRLGEEQAPPISGKRPASGSRAVIGSVVGLVAFVKGVQPFEACNTDREKRELVSRDESAIEKTSLDEMVSDKDGVIAGGARATDTE
jgi:hypothetical protein